MNKSDVIEHFAGGADAATGIRNLSEALGIQREAIYQWGSKIPELRALQIEKLTNGKLKAGYPNAQG